MGQDRAAGKVAMWFQYQSNVIANQADATQINPSVVGIAPMPKGPTGITANEANAYMWGISSQIKDPRVRDAAWQFVKFMASDEADRIRTQAYVEAGLGNTVNPVALQKYGYEDYTSPQSKVWLQDQPNAVRARPPGALRREHEPDLQPARRSAGRDRAEPERRPEGAAGQGGARRWMPN